VSVLRFLGLLVWPLFAPFAILLLVIAYVVLYCIVGLWQTWLRAKRDPRHDPYWWVD